jgi:hypothetical protein
LLGHGCFQKNCKTEKFLNVPSLMRFKSYMPTKTYVTISPATADEWYRNFRVSVDPRIPHLAESVGALAFKCGVKRDCLGLATHLAKIYGYETVKYKDPEGTQLQLPLG